jgi:luciferase family oxidoreductase group 1
MISNLYLVLEKCNFFISPLLDWPMQPNIRLSILDQSPIRHNSDAPAALQETIRLAKLADRLGYTRYWLSEHHNTITLAGASPEILIARLAAETTRIRIGSGGIMLPNHSTLKVAEDFRLLEALYPGRIDLGLGRAPGGDRLTAHLLNPTNTFDPNEYIRQIRDLYAFLADTPSPGNYEGKIRAIPRIDTQPDLWMLTSSGESAHLAAHFGMALCYAQFINPVGGAAAIRTYREGFKPSPALPHPQAAVGIFAFCSEDSVKVEETQALIDYRMLGFEKGRYDEIPTYAAASAYAYTPAERERILANRARTVIGTPDVVRTKFEDLAREFDVDEIVISTFTGHAEDRMHSYELLADIFGLNAARPSPKAEPATEFSRRSIT